MDELELRCLGPLELRLGGSPLKGLRTEKAKSLLCYLAVNRQTHKRSELAGMFWSDLPEMNARGNLRLTLMQLRRVLPEHLLITRDTVGFDSDSSYELDVEAFEAAFSVSQEAELAQLAKAVELYRGDFLESFAPPGAELFNEWVVAQREHLRQLAVQALHALAGAAAAQGDHLTAVSYLVRLLTLDPWHEEAHRQLMLVYESQGRPEAALAQYATCCQVLAEELGLEPTEETTLLYERIRQAGLGPKPETTLGSPRPVVERRYVTVLSTEFMVGASADPEDLHEHVAAFRSRCAEVVSRFGGYSQDGQGTLFIAYFGFPTAHEDDPRRATLAALAVQAQTRKIGSMLGVRIGIHSGVVVATLQDGGVDVVGLPLVNAQRLSGAGLPGEILMSSTTEKLVRGYFTLGVGASYQLDGTAPPTMAHRVISKTSARTRLEVSPPITKTVGQQAELSKLVRTFRTVCGGTGQAVLVTGDAGIGKSRLLFDFRAKIRDMPHSWTEIRGNSLYMSTPFYPIVDLLERELGLSGGEAPGERLARLQAYVANLGLNADEVLPLLMALFSLPAERDFEVSSGRRHMTIQVLVQVFLAKAVMHPLVLAFEDAHWYDPSTVELLRLMLSDVGSSRVMLLVTSRGDLGWGEKPSRSLMQVHLNGLSARDTSELVSALADGLGLSPEVRARLAAVSDGVPLYVEELVHGAVEGDVPAQGPLGAGLPDTLQGALTARLDRSGDAREVAQFAAVLGKSFSFNLLAAASPLPRSVLRYSLGRLVSTGLVFPEDGGDSYRFRHALVQEAAYGTLLKAQRQDFHARIVSVLAAQDQGRPNVPPELLAYHYSGASMYEDAVRAWQKACEEALIRSAYHEGIQHLKSALARLPSITEPDLRDELELALNLKLAGTLHITRGYASPEVGQAFNRALQLCATPDRSHHLFAILIGLIGYHVMRAEYEPAESLLGRFADLPKKDLKARQLVELNFTAGRVYGFRGKLDLSLRHLGKVYSPEGYYAGSFAVPSPTTSLDDVQVTALAQSAITHWLAGFPDHALRFIEQSLSRTAKEPNLHRRATSMYYELLVRGFRGELEECGAQLAIFVQLVEQQGMTSFIAAAKILHGAHLVMVGRHEGLLLIEEGFDLFAAQGNLIQPPHHMWLSALSLEHVGRFEDAAAVISEALIQCEATGEKWFKAELLRVRGGLFLRISETKKAVEQFCQSIALAQTQGAKSLELRARCDLVRVHQRSDELLGAQEDLLALLKWFTEGFDTLDVRRATALVESISC